MIGDDHALTPGYVARHVPPASRIGIDVAVLDIAQDFLLAHLAERGVLGDLVIFKGGTALRKVGEARRGPANLARARAKAVRPPRYTRPVRFHPAGYPVGAAGGDPR